MKTNIIIINYDKILSLLLVTGDVHAATDVHPVLACPLRGLLATDTGQSPFSLFSSSRSVYTQSI